MDRQDQDLRIRHIAQDAHLDQDLESMVPPTSSKSTFIVMVALLCVVAVAGLAIVLSAA
jgi:hypothetical protein